VKTIPYKEARKDFQPGDCLGWCGTDIVSRAIGAITKSEVTHVSVIIRQIEHDQVRWQQIEAGGEDVLFVRVGLNYVSERLKAYNGDVIWYKLHPDLEEYRPDIVTELLVQVGTGYDYTALVKSLFGRPPVSKDQFICSELAEWGYKTMPLRAFQKHPEWFADEEFRVFISDRMSWPSDIVGLPLLLEQGVLG